MPDEELFKLAGTGELRLQLDGQVKRMLKDPKASAFAQNFSGQWLTLRSLANINPDPKVFPGFDADLRAAMRRETELFFEAILVEDRSILDFIDADFSFVNERLAKHYGISGVKGKDFRRVKVPAQSRRHPDARKHPDVDLVSRPHVAGGSAANGCWRPCSTRPRRRRRKMCRPWKNRSSSRVRCVR